MKIVINAENIVIHAAAEIELTEGGVSISQVNPHRKLRDGRLTSANATLYEVPTLPDDFRGGCYTYTPEDGFTLTASGNTSMLPDAKTRRKQETVRLREVKEKEGVLFHFSDTDSDGTIQIRDATDLRNIQGIVSTALVLTVSGNTTPLHFKDAENVEHEITAAEAMALGTAVSLRIHALYSKMWSLKAEIDASTTVGDVVSISIDTGWP